MSPGSLHSVPVLRAAVPLLAALAAGCGGAAGPSASGRALYVSAAAAPGGDGSIERPFDSLQALEAGSVAGDRLVVLPALPDIAPLDGGITLKPGQRLVGDGPPVLEQSAGYAVSGAVMHAALPRIRNSDRLRQQGDAVRLAADSEVSNLVITDSVRGAIYGLNVPGARVRGNDVSGFNTSCTIGFTVEPFVAPTRLPYFGVPLLLPAGWAGIMVDADEGTGAVVINDNYVHDGACGNGIDLRLSGSADYVAEISGNFVTRLETGPGGFTGEFHLVHAITTQVIDTARLVAASADNTQTFIGGPGADCEGLFMNLADSAHASWTIERNVFEHGIGGFSCNGMEFVVSHGAPSGEMFLSDSRFIDNPGDTLQLANLGRGSSVRLELDRVFVRDTTERGGSPENAPLPFNLGDCILAGSTGTDNTTVLRVRDSRFENCNNGLTILSGVSIENGTGPDGLIDVDIARSSFRNNAYNNVVVGVITPLRALDLRVEDTDLRDAGENVVALRQVDTGSIEQARIDLGGGALGSSGGNCLSGGSTHDVVSEGLAAALQRNWWGRPQGPEPARIAESAPGSLDLALPLSAAPPICPES